MQKLINSNEEIIIDNYKIELVSYLYDDYAKAGFCLFDVPSSTTTEGLNNFDGFGNEDRFELYHISMTDRKQETQKHNARTNIYYQFLAETDKNDNKIYLYDKNSGNIHDVSSDKSASASFLLKNNVKSKEYEMDKDLKFYLSDVCIGMVNTNGGVAVMPKEVKVCYKDGSVAELIKDCDFNSRYIAMKSNNEKHSFERCIFKDIMDVDDIESVNINNKIYK